MKKNDAPLVDEHLKSLEGMKEATTDDFFYTRLRARIDSRNEKFQRKSSFILRPGWTIATLLILLAMNGYMLSKGTGVKHNQNNTASTVVQFAQSYDQTINSY